MVKESLNVNTSTLPGITLYQVLPRSSCQIGVIG